LRAKLSKTILVACAGVAVILIVSAVRNPNDDADSGRQADLKRRLERFKSVPYTSLTRTEVDSSRAGVIIKDGRACDGYNLYCSRISPEVFLMDMAGKVVHRWSYPETVDCLWDHAIMLGKGEVIVINKFKHLVRLDWHSNLLWRSRMEAHHDLVECPDKTFYVASGCIRDYRGLLVRFPYILRTTSEGRVVDMWSGYEELGRIKQAFDTRSFLDTVIDSMLLHRSWLELPDLIARRLRAKRLRNGNVLFDYLHLNTIAMLPDTPLGRQDRRFRPGNLLLCFRRVNQIAIMDWNTKEFLWVWGEGELEWPHHPTMLENGNILIFDNGVEREYSRVIELNPVTEEIDWEYVADPPESFYTFEKGSAQRLPNGNTLICEGDQGRVFEVTSDGETVWEWLNPILRKGKRVQVYRMTRLPAGTIEPLLTASATPGSEPND
jgi:hypothetical protein